MSEREPHVTVTPQVAEASAAGLGTEPPSRSENAGLPGVSIPVTLTYADCSLLVRVIDQWLGEGFSSVEERLTHAADLRDRIYGAALAATDTRSARRSA